MNENNKRLHPIVWIAAIAVTAASTVGVAKMSGWLDKPAEPVVAAATSEGKTKKSESPRAPAKRPASERDDTKNNTPSYSERYPAVNSRPASQRYCNDCGVIEAVRTVAVPASATGVGAVAGGVLGGVLGHQVGEGKGKDVATAAGAVIGGITGHQVEKRVRTKTTYEVDVTMEDGTRRSIPYATMPTWNRGDRVEIRDGVISAATSKSRGVESL